MSSFKSTNRNTFSLDPKKDPHGWIQWKGTDVCMDIHCKCGEHSHIDAEFVYFIQCPKCKTIYEVNGHVQLIERDPAEVDVESIKIPMDDDELYGQSEWK
jgi:phage FluMu protein Com